MGELGTCGYRSREGTGCSEPGTLRFLGLAVIVACDRHFARFDERRAAARAGEWPQCSPIICVHETPATVFPTFHLPAR